MEKWLKDVQETQDKAHVSEGAHSVVGRATEAAKVTLEVRSLICKEKKLDEVIQLSGSCTL